MREYPICLDTGETYPLARALTFTHGDGGAATLKLRFTNAGTPLGTQAGCAATLSILSEGETTATLHTLTAQGGGVFTLALTQAMLAGAGIRRCIASLYDADGGRRGVSPSPWSTIPPCPPTRRSPRRR